MLVLINYADVLPEICKNWSENFGDYVEHLHGMKTKYHTLIKNKAKQNQTTPETALLKLLS